MTTQILMALIAFAATTLPGLLKQDGLPSGINGVIAGVVVIAGAVGEVLVGGKLTGNPSADIALFAAAFSALLAGPLKPLDAYLTSNWSFFKAKPATVQVTPANGAARAAQRRQPYYPPSQNSNGDGLSGG